MMSYEQAEILVKAIGIIVSLIITFVIKPLIDSKISATEQEKLENYIRVAVRCAEQIYTPEQWREKKLYVTDFISNILADKINLALTADQLDTLIEGLVNEVKHE